MTGRRESFGAFVIDLDDRLLFHGDRRVPLRPQVARALCHLVENRGHVVSRRDLGRAVWGGEGGCDDQALNVVVRGIRKALDDDPLMPRYLETIPRRGYRFIGRRSGTAWRERFRLPAMLAAGVVAAIVAVAGFPGTGQLRTPQSVGDLPAAAQELFLGAVAEFEAGRRFASRSAFSALSDRYPDFADAHLWLGMTYTTEWGAGIDAARAAAPHFHRALELKPDLPAAHVELGKIAMITDLDAATAAGFARRALALDPRNLDARILLIDTYLAVGDAWRTPALIEEIATLDPLRLAPMGTQGWIEFMAGRYDEAIRQCRIALDIGRAGGSARNCLYEAYLANGDMENALRAAADIMVASGEPAARLAATFDSDPEASNRRFLEWRLARAMQAVARGGDTYQAAVTLTQLGDTDGALARLSELVEERRYPAIAFIASDPRLRELTADAAGSESLAPFRR